MIKIALSCFLAGISYVAIAQTQVDTSLLNNSTRWKFKTSWGFFSGMVGKASFGDFKTLNIDKGEKKTIFHSKDKFLSVGSNTGIKKTVIDEKNQPFALTIGCEGGDSAIVNMILSINEKSTSTVVRFSNHADETKFKTFNYCKNATIIVDSVVQWKLITDTFMTKNAIHFRRYMLSSDGDSISIERAMGFKKVRKIFGVIIPEGWLFIQSGKQLAAIQQYPESAVWLKNDLPLATRKAFAAAILTILGSTSGIEDVNYD